VKNFVINEVPDTVERRIIMLTDVGDNSVAGT
jgi:hypothetical protein